MRPIAFYIWIHPQCSGCPPPAGAVIFRWRRCARAWLFCLAALICMLPVAAAGGRDGGASGSQAQEITEAEWAGIFSDYLCRQLGKMKKDVLISKFRVSGNGPLPAGDIRLQLFQKSHQQLKGYVHLTAAVSIGPTVLRKVRLRGWVDVFETVLCAAHLIRRGTVIDRGDVVLLRRNTSNLSKAPLMDIHSVLGRTAKRNIAAETCLASWMLEKTTVVEKGDLVKILAESNTIRLSAPGKALMDGDTGDVIRIENLMSEAEIVAEVVDHATVRVNF